jgi:hypothetical protein
MGQDAAGGLGQRDLLREMSCLFWDIVDGRTPLCLIWQAIRWLKKSWPRFREYTRIRKKDFLVSRDSRSVFFDYVGLQIPQSSKRNKRSLTPTRALKKTRASLTEFGMTRQTKVTLTLKSL